jgi:late competence protein required for DNA uptake (superfamily II DNA/RNA helicase)
MRIIKTILSEMEEKPRSACEHIALENHIDMIVKAMETGICQNCGTKLSKEDKIWNWGFRMPLMCEKCSLATALIKADQVRAQSQNNLKRMAQTLEHETVASYSKRPANELLKAIERKQQNLLHRGGR